MQHFILKMRLVVGAAYIFNALSISLTIFLSTRLDSHEPAFGLITTAAVLSTTSFVAQLALFLAVFFLYRDFSKMIFIIGWTISITLSLIAAITSMISMVFVLRFADDRLRKEAARSLSIVGLSSISAGLVLQALIYFWIWSYQPNWSARQKCHGPIEAREGSVSYRMPSYPISSGLKVPSRTFAFGPSMHRILRPVTSTTRLVTYFRDPYSSQSKREEPQHNVNRYTDDFNDWEPSTDDHFKTSTRGSAKQTLATIPGSRPSSAYMLKVPFVYGVHVEERPPVDHVQVSPQSTLASPASETGPHRTLPRGPSVRRPSTSKQAYIHPLFRSESPVPPPLASPGTTITASPFAGQVQMIGPEHVLAPRLSSRPASPGLVPMKSRPGSSSRGVSLPPPLPKSQVDSSIQHSLQLIEADLPT